MQKNIAVITGASSGLGREYVKILSMRNDIDEIWAIARNIGKLEKLKADFGNKVIIFSKDLSDRNEVLSFREILKRENPCIKWMINNAGFAKLCSYEDISVEESINMIDLNCSGVVAMGLLCIPHMQENSKMLNIASQASFQPLPYQNLYSSTKAFVRNYSRALNVELKEKRITVTAVCPGWMDTAFFKRAQIKAKKASTQFWGMVTPDKVAVKSIVDAEKGKDISVYSLYVKFCHVLAKILPQRAMMKIWLMQQRLN